MEEKSFIPLKYADNKKDERIIQEHFLLREKEEEQNFDKEVLDGISVLALPAKSVNTNEVLAYLLSKSPEEIKLSSIIQAVDEKVKTVGCKKESKKGCTGKSIKCITHNLWDDLESHINSFFEKNTLGDIIFRVTKDKQKELN